MAEYFDLDPTLMRLLWFVSIFFTGGLSILLYLRHGDHRPLEPMTDMEATQLPPCRRATATPTRGEATGRWRRSSASC